MTDLTELIERVRNATGMDRAIDGEIWRAAMAGQPRPVLYGPVPPLTASVYAITALIEKRLPGWQWAAWGGAIELGSTRPRCMAHVSDGQRTWHTEAPTTPLALTLAFLLAIQENSRDQ